MALQGADVAQLRTTATQFAQGASALETAAKALHALISNGTQWRGPDADRFRSEWTGVSTRTISAAVETLRRASDELRRNADQQDQASEARAGESNGSFPTEMPQETLTAPLQDSSTPSGTGELFANIPEGTDTDGVNDGMRVQKVIGPDGETRFIVYFGGTDDAINRPVGRNGIITGIADPVLIERIKEATKGYPNADIMLVGFSQGGMDAQNIAASGALDNVTNVATYGSPITQSDSDNYDSVHLRAKGDGVPGWSTTSSDHVFEATAVDPTPTSDLHGDDNTYTSVGQQFDNSTDGRWDDAQKSMAKFYRGTVLPEF